MNPSSFSATHWHQNATQGRELSLISEEPLSIRVDGHPYSVVMRTPGNETAHAAGFCLGEGIVDSPDDIASIGFCDGQDTNTVTITLSPQRRKAAAAFTDRRFYVSQTSCGLCGKQLVEELYQDIHPIQDDIHLPLAPALRRLEALGDHQPLRAETRAAHAAALYDQNLDLLTVAEDVGRHNALDKAVGELFLKKCLSEAKLLILSSRISYELVQKAARARIPIILGMSRPTELAVTLADQLNMTLACLAGGGGLFIFTHPQRLHP